jgi:hypothetical protein
LRFLTLVKFGFKLYLKKIKKIRGKRQRTNRATVRDC